MLDVITREFKFLNIRSFFLRKEDGWLVSGGCVKSHVWGKSGMRVRVRVILQ